MSGEYVPKGGWIKFRKRQQLKERAIALAWLLAILLAYAFVGYLERGM